MMEAGGGAGFLSASQIYEQVTGGPGTGSLDAAYEAARLETQLEEQRAAEIRELADEIRQGWQGQAAEGAVGAVGPMADTARERADRLKMVTMLFDSQSQTFNVVKNSVVPVPPKPPESNIINDMVPWETDLDREIQQYQNDAQQNIAVYGRYDDSSLANGQQLPRQYPSITEWSGNISVTESGSSPGRAGTAVAAGRWRCAGSGRPARLRWWA